MTRTTLFRQLADEATRPLAELETSPQTASPATPGPQDLFVWFEDTSERQGEGLRGIAGLPESLLPITREARVIERRYAPGHFHLLTALRLRCRGDAAECIAAIYTAALAVGTVAWIGSGGQYELAWNALYAVEGEDSGLDTDAGASR